MDEKIYGERHRLFNTGICPQCSGSGINYPPPTPPIQSLNEFTAQDDAPILRKENQVKFEKGMEVKVNAPGLRIVGKVEKEVGSYLEVKDIFSGECYLVPKEKCTFRKQHVIQCTKSKDGLKVSVLLKDIKRIGEHTKFEDDNEKFLRIFDNCGGHIDVKEEFETVYQHWQQYLESKGD